MKDLNIVSQEEIEEVSKRVDNHDNFRGEVWFRCENLLKEGYKFEAYSLLLATWNFARFRFYMKTFDVNLFKKLITKEETLYKVIETLKFQTVDFTNEAVAAIIKKLYEQYREINGIEITGAAKLMALRKPDLLVMWDSGIREVYGFKGKGTPEDYLEFLIKVQKRFKHIDWKSKVKPIGKVIDEYNFDESEKIKIKKWEEFKKTIAEFLKSWGFNEEVFNVPYSDYKKKCNEKGIEKKILG